MGLFDLIYSSLPGLSQISRFNHLQSPSPRLKLMVSDLHVIFPFTAACDMWIIVNGVKKVYLSYHCKLTVSRFDAKARLPYKMAEGTVKGAILRAERDSSTIGTYLDMLLV